MEECVGEWMEVGLENDLKGGINQYTNSTISINMHMGDELFGNAKDL